MGIVKIIVFQGKRIDFRITGILEKQYFQQKKNISYSARAKRGSKRNPFVKEGDLISVKNSVFGKASGIIREVTEPRISKITYRI